ncbi:MAG: signal peptidase [Frondihabitans sp.]|nr:signal peptidase [Frondihabitans sp.]
MGFTVIALGVVLSLVWLATQMTPSTSAGYIASVKNSVNAAASNSSFTCANAVALDGGTSTKALFAYNLSDASYANGASAADASGSNHAGVYEGTGAADPVTTPVACPRDGTRAYALDGRTNWILGPSAISPSTFTEEVWFKTSASSGRLIGFGNAISGLSSESDRQIFVTPTGALAFGVYNLGNDSITSPLAYNDGMWHQVVVTFSGSTGSVMYVDGKQVASNATYNTARLAIGFWRIGYDNLSGWNSNANYYFTGSLRFATVYNSVLSPAQITNHYTAGIPQ